MKQARLLATITALAALLAPQQAPALLWEGLNTAGNTAQRLVYKKVSGEAESNLKFMLSGSSYGKGRSYGDHCIESFPLYRPHLLRIREELKALDPLAAAFYSASATEADFARFKTQFSRFATEVAGLEAALRQRPAQVNLLDECSAPTPAHGKLALSIFWAPMAERLASLVDVLGRNIAEVEKASR